MTMSATFTARASVTIKAPVSQVWDAITNPDLIKQYLFGTEVTTDWRVGGPITYRGVWEGKSYEDKGQVVRVEPGKLLVSTYWSSMSGLPDVPESYKTVRYELSAGDGGTTLAVIQDNNGTQEEATHAEQNWSMVLEGLKKLLEDRQP
jgi:uncharacterized protein YndB with AHSA1/START domain